MSFGMGMTFVPLTLTAVHHLRNEDSGIGSGVLNTMQQVGGALGLSLLGTIATQTIDDRVGVLKDAAEQAAAAGGPRLSEAQQKAAEVIAAHQVFTEGATAAFLLAAGLMVVASLVTWVFLNVKHEELATDGPRRLAVVGLTVSLGPREASPVRPGDWLTVTWRGETSPLQWQFGRATGQTAPPLSPPAPR